MRIKKLISLLLFIIVLLLILLSCNQDIPDKLEDNEKETCIEVSITEVTHSIFFMPLYVACDKGFFQEEGLEVQLNTCWNEDQGIKKLLNGETNFLLAGPENICYQIQQENKNKIIALAQICNSTGYFLLSKDSTNSFSWSDLKRKVVIGLNHGNISQMVLNDILKSHNIQPLHDVHLIQNIPLQTRPAAFLGEIGNYIILREPEASRIELQEAGKVVQTISIDDKTLVTNVLLSTEDYLNSNNNTSSKLINALYKSLQWLEDNNPETILDVANKYFPNEKEKALLRAICRYKNLNIWPENPCINITDLNNSQSLMITEKELNDFIPICEVISNIAKNVIDTYQK